MSRLLTFNSAFGRFKYTRMPFGISSASEVWERTITEMFDDISGFEVVRDDDVEEHDAVLRKVLDRALEKGLGLSYGRSDITVETDHKPLEALYKKPIGSAPPRIQRMMLRIQKY